MGLNTLKHCKVPYIIFVFVLSCCQGNPVPEVVPVHRESDDGNEVASGGDENSVVEGEGPSDSDAPPAGNPPTGIINGATIAAFKTIELLLKSKNQGARTFKEFINFLDSHLWVDRPPKEE